jgi:uncharacterized caspase-like protein
MRRLLILLVFFVVAVAHSAAVASERRFALVIGNGTYRVRTLPTPVNDAALIAQTLQASGFEITSLRNLNEAGLRQSFRDFLIKVKNAGPDVVVAVYFAGLGLQCAGENYLLPIDADINQASDVLGHALPLSEQTHSLAALRVKASFLILDAARASPFMLSGRPPASGLAWMEPEANVLLAFNATPGTVARDSTEGYGAYAIALAEMIRQGGLEPEDLFDRVRLRVNELTGGAQVPWDTANIQTRFEFSERSTGAPKRADSPERTTWMRSQPMRKLSPDDAYWIALLRDTFDSYAEFVAEYWNDPMAKRVEALLAARRESITWRRSNEANVPDAYWTYLELYPHGPHVADAERLLAHLGAVTTPPPKFRRLDYDVPPPLPAELEFTDQPVLSLDDSAFAFAPLKPPPAYFLEAPPSELQTLAQKAVPSRGRALPQPPPLSSPAYVSVPPQTPGPPDQVAISTADPTSGSPGTGAGQGGSLSHGPLLPAWASFLPKEGKTLGAPASAASSRAGEALFVSAALAPVSSSAVRRVGTTPANARFDPYREHPAGAPARLTGGSTQPPTTGSIAPASTPTGGGARPGPTHALTTSNIGPPGTQPGTQERTARTGQPAQSPPLPGTRAAGLAAPPAGNGPKLGAGAAPKPKTVDQAAQPTVRKRKPEPPTTLAPSPEVLSATPQSERNPCTVSDGRLDCDDSR